MSNAVEMKRIDWNVMAVAIKLTGILCCATNENEKDRKLDTFVMFAPKSSITRQIIWDIETQTHTKDPCKCDYCQKKTPARLMKKDTKKVHFVKNKSFICKPCGKVFTSNGNRKKHKEVCTASSLDFKYICFVPSIFRTTSSRCVLTGFLFNISSTFTGSFIMWLLKTAQELKID